VRKGKGNEMFSAKMRECKMKKVVLEDRDHGEKWSLRTETMGKSGL
jgi:hypothetical protein